MPIPRNSLWFGMLALTLMCGALDSRASELRHSAWTLAHWALEAGNAAALSDNLIVYVQEGGTLVADDPFSALPLIAGLRALPGGERLAAQVLATRARGQFGGTPRIDLTLGPGQTHQAPLRLVADEITWIEARLWRGADGADIDITLRAQDGTVLAQDSDPGAGTEGAGALIQFAPQSCLDVTLQVINAGTGAGRVAIMIPQSLRTTCDGQ